MPTVSLLEGETAAVRCSGREGGEERERYRELFIPFPVGGGEHGNNAGLQDCGGHGPEPSGKNKLFAPSSGRQEHLCWRPALAWSTSGKKRASLSSWGLDLKDLTIHLLGSQSLLGPFPG